MQSNYVNILWMLLRLRQACDHPLLVKGHKTQGAQKVVMESARALPPEKRVQLLNLLESNRAICPICNVMTIFSKSVWFRLCVVFSIKTCPGVWPDMNVLFPYKTDGNSLTLA